MSFFTHPFTWIVLSIAVWLFVAFLRYTKLPDDGHTKRDMRGCIMAPTKPPTKWHALGWPLIFLGYFFGSIFLVLIGLPFGLLKARWDSRQGYQNYYDRHKLENHNPH